MKNWKRLVALLLALTMALSLCACKTTDQPTGGDPTDQPSEGAEPSLAPEPSADPEIEVDLTQDLLTFAAGVNAGDELLTIDGTAIPADLVLYWLFMNCENFASYYGMFGFNMADYADILLGDTVSMCTYYTTLRQKAAELGCLPTDAQIQDAHDRMMAEGEEYYETLKTAYGLSDDSMEYIFTTESYYQNLLDAMVPAATDEMLNNYIYQARHILLATVDTAGERIQQEDGTYAYPPLDEATIAEKKQLAEDILAQLQAADDLDAKFNELMNEYSEDTRGDDGALASPDGYTTPVGQMVPEFDQGALALKPGEISGIVESSYGYHIILRGEVADLESYADDCRMYTLDQLLAPVLDGMTVSRSAALDALDLAEFHERYSAYCSAVVEQYESGQEGVG